MKKYIYELWNKEKENFSIDDIVISDRFITKDDKIGWLDQRTVCVKRLGNIDLIKQNGVLACLEYCATKYKNLKETLIKLEKEKIENEMLLQLQLIIANMGLLKEFSLGQSKEQCV